MLLLLRQRETEIPAVASCVAPQRMVDGPGDYRITGKSYGKGISVAPVSGKFGADGSGTSTVTIKVADSVRDGYYPLVH